MNGACLRARRQQGRRQRRVGGAREGRVWRKSKPGGARGSAANSTRSSVGSGMAEAAGSSDAGVSNTKLAKAVADTSGFTLMRSTHCGVVQAAIPAARLTEGAGVHSSHRALPAGGVFLVQQSWPAFPADCPCVIRQPGGHGCPSKHCQLAVEASAALAVTIAINKAIGGNIQLTCLAITIL